MPYRWRPRRAFRAGVFLAALTAIAGSSVAAPAAAADSQFPAGQEAFHTYAEMAAETLATATAHPDIVERFSIGRSYEGRELWAVKVSDNVGVDEPEPEVLIDGLHHGDEHMSLEMTLAVLRWLTAGYGSDERVTRIVDSREIWIVFALNPDGATRDILGGRYWNWRKNRQPNAGTTAIGTDLNRNYDYRWGCCGGSSGTASSTRYRGPKAFSAPETRAFRDFVASRVVDGRQQIRAALSFHTTGRLVMWPYGHTTVDVPGDMTMEDRAAFASMGRRMATMSAYTPIQASDLYITSGTSRDWLYGRYRIFAYTFELSPDSTPYPSASRIPSETGRNREAVLYLLEQADCPYRSSGKSTTRCGAFDDDLEINRGWRRNPLGTDTATGGAWARGNPAATRTSGGPKQLGTTASGSYALVTGPAAGTSAGSHDVDGGRTTVESPAIELPARAGQRLAFRYYLAHDATSSTADELRVQVVAAGGAATTVFLERGAANDDDAAWASASVLLDPWAGTTVRIRISATDAGSGSLVEAAVDDVRVTRS
ncbi:MAG TPA: M14 family metallopeptidase [Clostridia bacterium]|nr:M14 family metallopeptidase [Clostridia bacterium]